MLPRRDAAPPETLSIVIAAFAARAAIPVLQTALYRVVAYDSPANKPMGIAVVVAYAAVDAALLVGLLRLARVGGATRTFARSAVWLLAFTASAGVIGLGSETVGWVSEVSPLSAGASLLALLALAPVARALGVRATQPVVVGVVVTLVFGALQGAGAWSSDEGDGRNLAVAWISWALTVARPAMIAALAYAALRATARNATPPVATAGGVYREAGATAETPPAQRPPLPPDLVPALRSAQEGLRGYRRAYLVRASVVPVAILVAAASAGLGGVGWLLLCGLAAGGCAGLILALARVRHLARAFRAAWYLRGALAARIVECLLDLLVMVAVFTVDRFDRAPLIGAWAALVCALAVLSDFLFAIALGRVGEGLDAGGVVERAASAQATAVVAVTMAFGFAAAVSRVEDAVAVDDHAMATVVCFALLGVALVAVVRGMYLQVRLAGQTRDAIPLEIGRATG
jgi:hypothetical protein